jgi:hypothetical protein
MQVPTLRKDASCLCNQLGDIRFWILQVVELKKIVRIMKKKTENRTKRSNLFLPEMSPISARIQVQCCSSTYDWTTETRRDVRILRANEIFLPERPIASPN